jgi:hypothetical protein
VIDNIELKYSKSVPGIAVSVSPNPISDNAVIQYSLEEGGTATLVLSDINGRRVRTLAENTENTTVILNKDELPAGTYILSITTDYHSSVIEKIVIQ